MTSIMSYFRKHSSNFLKLLILVEIEDSLKTAVFLMPLFLKQERLMAFTGLPA